MILDILCLLYVLVDVEEVKVERQRVKRLNRKLKVMGMNLVLRGLSPHEREKG
jgi:hypothetical protein